jgi:hypothetical protein
MVDVTHSHEDGASPDRDTGRCSEATAAIAEQYRNTAGGAIGDGEVHVVVFVEVAHGHGTRRVRAQSELGVVLM